MPTFAVYHKQGRGIRFNTVAMLDELDRKVGDKPRGVVASDYVHVANVTAPTLEAAFALCQNVDGGPWFNQPGVELVAAARVAPNAAELPFRSLSVGDLLVLGRHAFEVDAVGFCSTIHRHPWNDPAFDAALQAARDAFWRAFADAYPGAPGDLDPGTVGAFNAATEEAAAVWHTRNVADEVLG